MVMNAAFFNAVRASLSDGRLSQKQMDVFNAIASAFDRYGDGDHRKFAYILATAWHETGRFRWLKEIWGPTASQKRYEGRADLGNTQPGDGKRFIGRGLVHITGRHNYTDWAKRLGIDIVAKPELAERLDIAARILVQGMMLGTFTGKKLADYIRSGTADYVEARRVVNGTDRAALIAGYAVKFQEAIEASAKGIQPSKPSPAPSAPSDTKSLPGAPSALAIAIVLAVLVAVFLLNR